MLYRKNIDIAFLLNTIDEIIKFGIYANLPAPNKEIVLEQNLVRIYSLYFDISFEFDEAEYPDFDNTTIPDIRKNVETNFKDFGLYKTVLELNDIYNLESCGIGDAIDDLTDIIRDLIELKGRIENNSVEDGLWFFQLIFKSHTQQHVINLLNYMKYKKG